MERIVDPGLPEEAPSARRCKTNRSPSRTDALDGLRAAAILAVLGAHGSGFLPGGGLGVDLFFVLSGFLITGLLVAEHDKTGTVNLKRFYARRCLRLLPLYVVVVVAVLALTAAFYYDRLHYGLALSAASLVTYTANGLQVLQPESLYLLNHTWTLAIEWQFYLLSAPLVASLLYRGRSYRELGWWLVVAAMVLAIIRASVWEVDPDPRWYFSTTSHADALLLGAAFACLRRGEGGERRLVSGLLAHPVTVTVAIGTLTAAVLLLDDPDAFLFLGGYTLVAVASLSLIAFAMQGHGRLHGLMSARGVVRLGQISYGVYLLHFPIFTLLGERSGLPHAVWLPIALFTTLAAAEISFRRLEQPFLRLKDARFAVADQRAITTRRRRAGALRPVGRGWR